MSSWTPHHCNQVPINFHSVLYILDLINQIPIYLLSLLTLDLLNEIKFQLPIYSISTAYRLDLINQIPITTLAQLCTCLSSLDLLKQHPSIFTAYMYSTRLAQPNTNYPSISTAKILDLLNQLPIYLHSLHTRLDQTTTNLSPQHTSKTCSNNYPSISTAYSYMY